MTPCTSKGGIKKENGVFTTTVFVVETYISRKGGDFVVRRYYHSGVGPRYERSEFRVETVIGWYTRIR